MQQFLAGLYRLLRELLANELRELLGREADKRVDVGDPGVAQALAILGPMPGISSSEVEVTGGSGCGSAGRAAWARWGRDGVDAGDRHRALDRWRIVAIAALRSLSPSRVRSENRVVAVCAALMLASRNSTEARVSSTLSRAASPATTWSLTPRVALTGRSTCSTPPTRITTARRARATIRPSAGCIA